MHKSTKVGKKRRKTNNQKKNDRASCQHQKPVPLVIGQTGRHS